ncbi:hypothetical protein D3C87_1727950 [compost metagenome]
MAAPVQRAGGVGLQAAPAGVVIAFERGDLGNIRQEAERGVAALAGNVFKKDEVAAAIAVECLHGQRVLASPDRPRVSISQEPCRSGMIDAR